MGSNGENRRIYEQRQLDTLNENLHLLITRASPPSVLKKNKLVIETQFSQKVLKDYRKF